LRKGDRAVLGDDAIAPSQLIHPQFFTMTQDFLPASIIAILCFGVFAISVALIIGIINLLILIVRSSTNPNIPSDDFYSQVKDLMMSDLVPSGI
jgi:hypothetical protein